MIIVLIFLNVSIFVPLLCVLMHFGMSFVDSFLVSLGFSNMGAFTISFVGNWIWDLGYRAGYHRR